jgi:hypothetical protein
MLPDGVAPARDPAGEVPARRVTYQRDAIQIERMVLGQRP